MYECDHNNDDEDYDTVLLIEFWRSACTWNADEAKSFGQQSTCTMFKVLLQQMMITIIMIIMNQCQSSWNSSTIC